MALRTPLYPLHERAGARFVEFVGWDMPLHYGSQIAEHNAVRQSSGVFDVSHMTVIEITGHDSEKFLGHVLANDIARADQVGKALYSTMLNDEGHILDDLILYRVSSGFLTVVNCATRQKDLDWLNMQAEHFDCLVCERPDLAVLAIQGPDAIRKVTSVVDGPRQDLIGGLGQFRGSSYDGWFIARTGYTGEQGLEVILPGDDALQLWMQLMDAGVFPAGLAARDTLRLEAGMNLYGNEMDETVSPLESNIASTVALDGRDFIGADALRSQMDTGVSRKLVGLVLKDRGVLRAHFKVSCDDQQVGLTTSGAFSPTLQCSIALARVTSTARECTVEIRGKQVAAEMVKPPFVRNGKQVYRVLH